MLDVCYVALCEDLALMCMQQGRLACAGAKDMVTVSVGNLGFQHVMVHALLPSLEALLRSTSASISELGKHWLSKYTFGRLAAGFG